MAEPRPQHSPDEMILPDYEGDQAQDEGPEEEKRRRHPLRYEKRPRTPPAGR